MSARQTMLTVFVPNSCRLPDGRFEWPVTWLERRKLLRSGYRCRLVPLHFTGERDAQGVRTIAEAVFVGEVVL